MTYVKNTTHRFVPFSSETSQRTDFYIYYNVEELAAKCESCKEDMFKCRTVGILESINGSFYLSDMESKLEAVKIRVSLIYIKTPIKSLFSPQTVQLLGTMQWKNRPVLFANLIQDLTPAMAVRLQKAMSGVSAIHLAEDDQKSVQ